VSAINAEHPLREGASFLGIDHIQSADPHLHTSTPECASRREKEIYARLQDILESTDPSWEQINA